MFGAGQLRLFDPDPTLSDSELIAARRGQRGWAARERAVQRWGDEERFREREVPHGYVPRPHTPRPAAARERRLLVLFKPPPADATRAEIEALAGKVVASSQDALRARF